ncbi:MAG: NADase-type glycan-binding domain-containing protein, partial [Candidatus Nanopelagicales bacterium]
FGTIADEDDYVEPISEPEPELEVDMLEEVIGAAAEESNFSLESRAPQSLDAEEVHVTIALAHEVERTVECSECGRMNVDGHRFCDLCGAVLGNAKVAPWVVPVIEEESTEESGGELTEEGKRKQRRRASKEKKKRMSGSWRNPLIFLTVLGLLLSSFAFAFFGPGAFRFRFGMTRAIQMVTQFVDPYSGKSARITEVSATSSLPGTSPTEAGYSDARTFWASAPSEGFGVGTSLTYTFDSTVEINRMVIFPGIQSAQFDVRALAAPRTVTLSFDDGVKTTVQLDPLESPSDYRQLVKFDHHLTSKVTMTIDAVYPPRGVPSSGIGSVAISGTEFLEVPAVPEFFGFQQ